MSRVLTLIIVILIWGALDYFTGQPLKPFLHQIWCGATVLFVHWWSNK